MLIKEKSERNTLEMVSLEGLVPQDHLLRKIDCAVDFTHIYDFVVDLYCADNGVPAWIPWFCLKWCSSSIFTGSRPCGVPWKKSI